MIRRHSLVWLSGPPAASCWQEAAAAWQEAGNPFIACRTREGEELSLGFCLPAADGAEPPVRIGVSSREAAVASVSRPPDFFESAPRLRVPDSLVSDLAPLRRFFDVRVLGSRMWQVVTGVGYVRGDSDLDLVLDWAGEGSPADLEPVVPEAALRSGLRLDVEISLPALGEIHWNEWFSASPSVMVKATDGVRLLQRNAIAASMGNPLR